MTEQDVVIVGSGINSLVCAAELTLKGRKVLVLERAPKAGGCIQTEEVTRPGFRHDLFSMSYPLFVTSPFYPQLQPKLAAFGVEMVSAEIPTGVVLSDGRSLLFHQSRAKNIAAFEAAAPGDGRAHESAMQSIEADAGLIFGLLGQEPRSASTLKTLARSLFQKKVGGMAAFGGEGLMSCRDWLEKSFQSDLTRALIAPWVLHVGLGTESTMSALMTKVIMFTLEQVGVPFIRGGSHRIVEAFTRIIEEGGGAVLTGQEASRVIVERGRACAVITSSGDRHQARRAIVCNVTPPQLYGRLLGGDIVSQDRQKAAENYRFGRADMQIHIALAEPPRWNDPDLARAGVLHLTPGLDGVSRAVNEAERGLLPVEGTIVVGQPAHVDPSRVPSGNSLLWIQLQELPRKVLGDAAGKIAVPADGRWNDALAKAYADRILKRLGNHISNLESATLDVHVIGPHGLEAWNMNLVGGDPYSGACSIDQFHLFRPFGGAQNHQTGIKGLYHIGASTHPGPGLGGMSGHMAAQAIG